MKKTISLLLSGMGGMIGCLLVSLSLFSSCQKSDQDTAINPFDDGNNERNKIFVISDIHLGANLAYAETNKNLKPLENFLKKIKMSPNVKELVIAGDLVDEWFVPATVDTYNGKDQADFVKRVALANKGVVDALNEIIKGGKVLVTYVPGNHDLTITEQSVELIFPGISQARDNKLGLGTYSPATCSKIAIEHGHRYNFFCAPDPISNQDIAPGSITPPGYFFTRIAALSVVQKHPVSGNTIPVVIPNASGEASQSLLFAYWKSWEWALKTFTIENKFSEKSIVTNVNKFKGSYSVNDLLPYQSTSGGPINVSLYKGIHDSWDQRQVLNNVAVNIPTARAIEKVSLAEETDDQANLQYFKNPKSDKRIVIFGHTHVPKIIQSENHKRQKTIYANSGTWIDHNPNQTTMNFVVVTPQAADASSQTWVTLYNFENEVVTKMDENSLRLEY